MQAAALIVLVIMLVLAVYVLRPRARGGATIVADFPSRPVAENRAAPPFRLQPLEGAAPIALEAFTGKVVVLNFWASWCAPCRKEAPQLERLWRAYEGRRVQFLGVDHNDAREPAIAFVREFGVTYPSVFDRSGELARSYLVIGIPTTFIIRSDGRIAYRFLGKIDPAALQAALDRVIANSS